MPLTETRARRILGTYEVFPKDVVVPKENLVGEQGQGWAVMLSNLELERVLMSGGYVGVAQATLDEALAYSKARTAFGKQICAGHGFSTESVMSFRWRESIVAPISGGTSQIQRNGIARPMGLRSY